MQKTQRLHACTNEELCWFCWFKLLFQIQPVRNWFKNKTTKLSGKKTEKKNTGRGEYNIADRKKATGVESNHQNHPNRWLTLPSAVTAANTVLL